MIKGDKFTFDCEGNIGIKDFTTTYIFEVSKLVGGNTLYCVDKNSIEYSFLERDGIVYKFIKCLDEENRLDMLHREFVKKQFCE